MWLKKLVAVCVITVFIAMNAIVIMGAIEKAPAKDGEGTSPDTSGPVSAPPSIKLTILPGTVKLGSYAVISWSAAGDAKSCDASGDWSGSKTTAGRESTGRTTAAGVYTYTLKCIGDSGQSEASASLIVE